MKEESPILFSTQNNIATITLNRASQHNALNDQLLEMLNKALIDINNDETIRVVIINANGKTFCAGDDLKTMHNNVEISIEDNFSHALQIADMLYRLYCLPKPTIVAVNGHVYGGGIGLLASADIVIASDKTAYAFTEVQYGIIPAIISPYVLNAIGARQSQRYFLTGESFTCQTAKDIGLVHEIVPAKNLTKHVNQLAQNLLKNAPLATRNAKGLIQRLINKPLNQDINRDNAMRHAKSRVSQEGIEGISAFIEKRQPNWNFADEKN